MSTVTWLLVVGLALGGSSLALCRRWRSGWVVGLAAGVLFGAGVAAGLTGLAGFPELRVERGLVPRLALLLAVASAVGLPLFGRALLDRE